MNVKTITEALVALRPGAEFIVNGNTLDGIAWTDAVQTRPTDDEILAQIGKQ